jgi:hypothetical protein
MTLLQQTHLIRASNPGMSFDCAWQQACSMQRVTGSFGRPTKSGDAVLIAEASGLDVHPKLKTELNKHRALEKAKQSAKTLDHVKRLQRIRELMETDPSLSFDSAFSRIIEQERSGTMQAHKDAKPEVGTLATVQASHPEWSEAQCEEFCWREYWT